MKFFLIALFSFALTGCFSQGRVQLMDEEILKYDQKIERDEAEEVPTNSVELTCPLMLPAIGPVEHTAIIHFDNAYDYSEENEMSKPIIRRVKFTLTSGSYEIKVAYHFNSTGELIRHTQHMIMEDEPCHETQYYFEKDTCFLIKYASKTSSLCTEEDTSDPLPEPRSDFNEKDQKEIERILGNSQRFNEILVLYHSLLFDY